MGCCLELCSRVPLVEEGSLSAREWHREQKEYWIASGLHSPFLPLPSFHNLRSSAVGAYVCTGNISGWTKCSFLTKTPNKVPWKIPQELKDASPEL